MTDYTNLSASGAAWTDERIQLLTELWRARNSAGEIAAILAEKTGHVFTRNAVIGKVRRLGLLGEGHPKNTPRAPAKKPRKPRTRKPPESVQPDPYDLVLIELKEKREQIDDAPRRLEPLAPSQPPAADVAREEAMQDLASEAQALFPEMHIYEDVPPPEDEIAVPVSDRVTLFDLTSGVCRFPLGDPLAPDFSFCGAACDATRSYCTEHHALSYRPNEKPKRATQKAYR